MTVLVVALCAQEYRLFSDTSIKAEVAGGRADCGWSAAGTGTDVPTKDAQSARPPDGLGGRKSLKGAACPPPPHPGVRRRDLRTPSTEQT